VAIITGNSNSGSSCIQELFERYSDKVTVRGIFRSKDKAQPFIEKYPNLEVITGVDAYQPETLKVAFEGADSALIVTPHDPNTGSGDDAKLTANMINQAVACHVKYIVLVGSISVHTPLVAPQISNRFIESERLLEKLSKETNLKYTVLRGGFFMENLLWGLKSSLKSQSAIILPNIHMAMVDTKDIGKSAAACLAAHGEGHHGKYYEMNKFLFNKQLSKDSAFSTGGRPIFKCKYIHVLAQLIAETKTDLKSPISPLFKYNHTFQTFIYI
jgi:uncharacterized protein YbjT (DUF2867 family)